MAEVVLDLTRKGVWGIIICVMITGMVLTGCRKGAEKIERCGDLEVIGKILQRADIKVEGHEVEVRGGLCLHKVKVDGKTLVIYYVDRFYFVGVAFDEKGLPVKVEEE